MPRLPFAPQDTTFVRPDGSTAYDTVWAAQPEAPARGLEQVMLAHDKLYVVLGVVLLIWFGLLFFLFRTDRRLRRLERTLDEGIPEDPA